MTDHAEMTNGGREVEEDWVSVSEYNHFSRTARSHQRGTEEDSERRRLTKKTTLTDHIQTAYTVFTIIIPPTAVLFLNIQSFLA